MAFELKNRKNYLLLVDVKIGETIKEIRVLPKKKFPHVLHDSAMTTSIRNLEKSGELRVSQSAKKVTLGAAPVTPKKKKGVKNVSAAPLGGTSREKREALKAHATKIEKEKEEKSPDSSEGKPKKKKKKSSKSRKKESQKSTSARSGGKKKDSKQSSEKSK